MPITVAHNPDARAVAAAAYEGGLGLFAQKQREMAQQMAMQQNDIQARQQSQVFAAQQEAQNRYNQTLWDASNRDVMANRDMGRAQQMGTFKQGMEKEQFGWQQQAQDQQRDWQADQAAIARGHQQQMAEADDERQRQLQAEQLRNQGPVARQFADLDQTEERIRGMDMEDAERADYLAQVDQRRKTLLGAMKQPTPQEKQAQIKQEWETNSVPQPDGSRVYKNEKTGNWDSIMPSGKNAQLENETRQKQLAVQAENAQRTAMVNQAKHRLDFIAKMSERMKPDEAAAMYDAAMPKVAPLPPGQGQAGGQAGGLGQPQVQIPPAIQQIMAENNQQAPVPVQSSGEARLLRPGTVFVDQLGNLRVAHPRVLRGNHSLNGPPPQIIFGAMPDGDRGSIQPQFQFNQ